MMSEHERALDALREKMSLRFEIAAIRFMSLSVQRYFDRRWLRGVQWTPEQIETTRQQEARRQAAAATARAGERPTPLPHGALATPRGG